MKCDSGFGDLLVVLVILSGEHMTTGVVNGYIQKYIAGRSRYWRTINYQQGFWKRFDHKYYQRNLTSYWVSSWNRIIVKYRQRKERILNLEKVRWPYSWAWSCNELFHWSHMKSERFTKLEKKSDFKDAIQSQILSEILPGTVYHQIRKMDLSIYQINICIP